MVGYIPERGEDGGGPGIEESSAEAGDAVGADGAEAGAAGAEDDHLGVEVEGVDGGGGEEAVVIPV